MTNESTPLVVTASGLLANDLDLRSRALTAVLDTPPSQGTFNLNSDGTFTYLPNTDFFGTDTFTYHASNGFVDSESVTVTLMVNEVVPPPISVTDSYTTLESTILTIPARGVLANDSDRRSRPITAILNGAPSNGTIALSPNGGFIYTPAFGYYGTDSFTYSSNNGFRSSNPVTVNLVVQEVIPAPIAVADSYTTQENIPLEVPAGGLLTNDFDLRGRPLTAVIDTGPNHGVLLPNNGGFKYTPTSGYYGSDSFTYRATNGFVVSNIVVVSLTIIEVIPPPVAVANSYTTNENSLLTVPAASGLLTNDSDPRARPLTAVIDTPPAQGVLNLNPNGSFTYSPVVGFYGTDTFTYHARNGFKDSNVVTVTLTINEVIPPPVAVADSFSTNESTGLFVAASGVLGNDSDPRGRPLTAVLVAGPTNGTLTLNANGSFNYTPTLGYFGTDSFTYRARNGFLNSGVVTVKLIINEVVPPPVATADSYVTNENIPLVVSTSGLLANDSDPRSRPLTAILDAGPARGSLILNPNGSFTYTPNAGYFGTDSFTYRARNGVLNSSIVTVNLTINEVIPPPVATTDAYATSENVPLVVSTPGVLGNDSDPRARPLTAILVAGPTNGTLTLNASGSFNYTPTAGYLGTDSFTYRAHNGFLNSGIATVNLTINEVIPPPVAVADSFSTNENTVLVLPAAGVLANDSDPRGRSLTAVLVTNPNNGTINLNANGGFNYTPNNGFFGSDSFTYRARNGFLNSNVVIVSLTINEVIPPPVATADSYTTNENTQLAVLLPGVLANDSDPRARPLTAILVAGPTNGTLTLNTSGSFNYTPAAGYFGTDSFTYRARNGFSNSNVVTVSLTITEVIPPPVATADSYATNESTPLAVSAPGVLGNDSDPRGRPLTAVLVAGPTNGTLTLNANGSFNYTPTTGYFGNDSFTYRARNGVLNSGIVTVSLTINEVIPPPLAAADSYTTTESTPLTVSTPGVLANDSDPRSRPLTAILVTSPTRGTLVLNANGSFNYTPTAGYFGTDSFTYRARNGFLNSSIVTVTLAINEVIPAPAASADSYSTAYGTPLTIPAAGVLANDTDPRGRTITAILNSAPTRGTLNLSSNGSFVYTPTAGLSGADSFTYRANNGTLDSNIVSVNIMVNPFVFTGLVNGSFESGFTGWTATGSQHIQTVSPYIATDGTKLIGFNGGDQTPNAILSQSFATLAGQTYTLTFDLGVLAFNTNSQTMQVVATGTSNLLTRTIVVNGVGGGINRWFAQTFTFIANSQTTTLTFRDQSTTSLGLDMTLDNVRVTGPPIVNTNTAPVAIGESYSTNEGTMLVISSPGVLSNDTDAQAQSLTAFLNTPPSHGFLTLNTSGSFIYTPDTNYFGPDSFTYRASDGSLDSNIVAVNITITEVIPPPIAVSDTYSTNEGTPLIVAAATGLLTNDSDPRSRPLTAVLSSGPSNGTLSLNSNGGFTYTPITAYIGTDSFTYRANNGTLNSNIVTVNLVVNEIIPPPIGVNDSYSTTENTALVISAAAGLLVNDSDPKSRPLTAVLNTGPNKGTISLNPNGSFTYTPTAGSFGADSFTYRANNGSVNSSIVTVNLTVNEVIPPPVAVGNSYSTNESTALVVTAAAGVLANDSDPRSRPLTAVISSSPSNGVLVLNANGSFTYTPTTGYFGADSFTYRANNGTLNSNIVTVNLTISEVIPPPVAAGDSYATNEGTVLVVAAATGVLVNDSDPRSRPLTAILSTGPTKGTLSMNTNGSFTYTPNLGYFGADSFSYRANNGSGNSNIVTVNLTVNEVIPPPVAAEDSYSTNESTALVVAAATGVLANDNDPRSRPLTATLSTGPTKGTLSLNANGSFSYTPNAGYFGADSFTYRANNGTLNSSIVTVNLTVNEVIPPPVAVSDSYSTNESTALVVPSPGVLANDSDPRSRPLTALLNTGPSNGTLALNANGSFTYTPASGYFGSDSFTYRTNNGTLNSNTVTVSLTVNEVIPPPVAVSDSYSTNQNTPLVIAAAGVLANDSDPRSRPLTAELSTGPSKGTLTLNANGSFTYTPTQGISGADSFTYRANNGFLSSSLATVSININPPTTGPLVNGSFESDFVGWTATGNLFTTSTAPYTGTDGVKLAGFSGANTTPNAVLSQTFTTVAGQSYTLSFDFGVVSFNTNSQTIQVTVTGTGSLLSQTLSVFGDGLGTARWFPQTFTFVANSNSTTLTFRDQSTSTSGIDPILDNVRISPNAIVNTAPVAVADSYSTNQNTALVVAVAGVLANDTDAQSQPLTATLNTGPSNGTLTLNANGGFTYTPTNGYSGADSFTYRANDGSLNSNITTVSLTITPVVTVGLVNGSFESGFTGWTSTGNQSIQTASIFLPTNGTKLVGFNGANTTPNAVLSQSFATTPGQTCTLAFDAGVFAYNTNSQTLQVTVTGTSSLLTQTVTILGNGLGTPRWLPQSFSFVANSATTTLTFRDQSATTAAIDLLLDNVRVTAAGAGAAPVAPAKIMAVSTPPPADMGPLALAGAPGDFTIRMTADQPGYYVLERSEDLSHWEFVTEKQVTKSGPVEFRDTANPILPQNTKPKMFYRVGRQSTAGF